MFGWLRPVVLGFVVLALVASDLSAQKLGDVSDKEDFNIIPGQCASNALTEGDSNAGATGGKTDRYTFAWGGGDLTFRMDSPDFNEIMVIAGPPGFEVVVNNSASEPEVYVFPNAPGANYQVLTSTQPGMLGDYEFCVFPGQGIPTPTQTPGNSVTPPIGPGECIEQRLDFGDRTFADETFFDEYILDWPGGDLLIAMRSTEFDAYLIIREPDGTRTDVDDPISGAKPESFFLPAAPAGFYIIQANSFGVATGGYTLCVNNAACTNVLLSDSFNRPDADRCNLGMVDNDFGGSGVHSYLPLWPTDGVEPFNPIGADIANNHLENNGLDFGGVEVTQALDPCNTVSNQGENLGQDLRIHMDLLLPDDEAGNITRGGPFFRARAAARGDSLFGGLNGGYWVQLTSVGEVIVQGINPEQEISRSIGAGMFNPDATHTLDVWVQGDLLQVHLDGFLQTFNQNETLVSTVVLPPNEGGNDGAAGIAFNSLDNRGVIGGQRVDDFIVTVLCPMLPTPTGTVPTLMPTSTRTRTPTFTGVPPTPSRTPTPSFTRTSTRTLTRTYTYTWTETPTPSSTPTPSFTGTEVTPTSTHSPTPSFTGTVPTSTPTFTGTQPTFTPTITNTIFIGITSTFTPTSTDTRTPTATRTRPAECDPPCEPPPTPWTPHPIDGATGVSVHVRLTWNDTPAGEKPIYGNDDRLDIWEVLDPDLLNLADSTVVFLNESAITDNGDGTFTIDSTPTLATKIGNPCPDEPFLDQPAPGFCSGFLVGPDLIATAGHCITDHASCDSTYIVFGFDALDPFSVRTVVPDHDVFRCSDIVARRLDGGTGEDWAVIQLDREVVCHQPLDIRRSGKIPDNQALTVIGHPRGMPKKVAGNANVRDNTNQRFFSANLDTYTGNSGSPVFNTHTRIVEGILVRGDADYTVDVANNCRRSVVCADNGCRGESVTRTTLIDHLIPALTEYDVYFGKCDQGMVYQGTTEDTVWDLPTLEQGMTYCWQIVARNICGEAPGEVWTFSTGEGEFPTPTITPTPTCPEYTEVNLEDVLYILDLVRRGLLPIECLLDVIDGWKVPTQTPTPTETDYFEPTETETPLPTFTETPTETLFIPHTETFTPTETETETPTETLFVPPTETFTPTETGTETLTETPTETVTETATATEEAGCIFDHPSNPLRILISQPSDPMTTQRIIHVAGQVTNASGVPDGNVTFAELRINGDPQQFSVDGGGNFDVVVILRSGMNTIEIYAEDVLGLFGCTILMIESTTPQTTISATLTWNLGQSDVDLYVIEPDGQAAWYTNKMTTNGGALDVDNRSGFGPENYFISSTGESRVLRGDYRIRVHYYDDGANNSGDPMPPTRSVGWTVHVLVNEGTDQEQRLQFNGSLSTENRSNDSPTASGGDWADVVTINPCPGETGTECGEEPPPGP